MIRSKNQKEPLLGTVAETEQSSSAQQQLPSPGPTTHFGMHPTKVVDNCDHGTQSLENGLKLRGEPIGGTGIDVKKVSGRLLIQICLSLLFFFVEFMTGMISGSLALIADSYHMAADVMALIVAYLCLRMANRQSKSNSYGWVRAEALGGFFNGLFLLTVCFSIFQEALSRILTPRPIGQPLQVLCVGVIGLVINLVGLVLLNGQGHGHSHGGGGGHGHSHGGGAKHGHSHDKGHGHSHKKGHGHSHEEEESVQRNVEFVEDLNDTEETELRPLTEGRTSRASTSFERRFTGPGTPYATRMASEILNDKEDSEVLVVEKTTEVKPKKEKKNKNVNIHGVYLHLMSDAFGSIIVIFTASIVHFVPEWKWSIYLDPALSLILAAMMSLSATGLVKDSMNILLMKAPSGIDKNDVKHDIEKIVGVSAAEDIKIWALTSSRLIASARVTFCHPALFPDAVFKIRKYFHDAGIHSTTIEPTFEEMCMDSMRVTCEEDCARKALEKVLSDHPAPTTCDQHDQE